MTLMEGRNERKRERQIKQGEVKRKSEREKNIGGGKGGRERSLLYKITSPGVLIQIPLISALL